MRSRTGPGGAPALDRPSPITSTTCRAALAGGWASSVKAASSASPIAVSPARTERGMFSTASANASRSSPSADPRPRRPAPPARRRPDHSSSAPRLASAGPPVSPAITSGSRSAAAIAAGDQVELVVGHARRAVERQHQRKVHRVHAAQSYRGPLSGGRQAETARTERDQMPDSPTDPKRASSTEAKPVCRCRASRCST